MNTKISTTEIKEGCHFSEIWCVKKQGKAILEVLERNHCTSTEQTVKVQSSRLELTQYPSTTHFVNTDFLTTKEETENTSPFPTRKIKLTK